MSEEVSTAIDEALRILVGGGLLLLQDARLPSLATVVVGAPVRGSWWGHPAGQVIFHAAGALEDHEDVATTKLVAGKVTFVHRSLWQPLVAAGRSRERWQLDGLSPAGRALLERIDAEPPVRASGKPAKELERRLLAASRQVHTDTGAHATELVPWKRFAEEMGMRSPRLSPVRARQRLEAAAASLAPGRMPALPWTGKL